MNLFSLSALTLNAEKIFTSIYNVNYWKGVSKSGIGSSLEATVAVRKALPPLLKKYNCKSMVDAPCGDFYWMQQVELPLENYIGVDIVKKIVQINQKKFSNDKISFEHRDITTQVLPKADIVLCRDCLGHISNYEVMNVIRLLKKSGCKYLLTTSFLMPREQKDIYTGGWRAINLFVEPFCFPLPLEIINENCLEKDGALEDKSLVLWKIESLPNF